MAKKSKGKDHVDDRNVVDIKTPKKMPFFPQPKQSAKIKPQRRPQGR